MTERDFDIVCSCAAPAGSVRRACGAGTYGAGEGARAPGSPRRRPPPSSVQPDWTFRRRAPSLSR